MNKKMKEIYDGYKYKDRFLPCPFCGGEGESPYMIKNQKKHFDKTHYSIMCGNCGAKPDFCVETEEEAITAWNKRITLNITQDYLNGYNNAKEAIVKLINKLEVDK